MLNIIWVALMIIGIIGSLITGKTDAITERMLISAGEAVKFAIGLIGSVSLWCGMIKILENAGAVRYFSKLLKPVMQKIFPTAKNNPKAQKAIITNITANFLGLGNGATPSGIEAVNELQGNLKDVCMFLVINSAGFQLIPSTVISMRTEMGASSAADILVPTWIVSAISLIAAVSVYLIISKIKMRKEAFK